jgi:hypothetical protein
MALKMAPWIRQLLYTVLCISNRISWLSECMNLTGASVEAAKTHWYAPVLYSKRIQIDRYSHSQSRTDTDGGVCDKIYM